MSADDTIEEAIRTMQDHQVRRLRVIDGDVPQRQLRMNRSALLPGLVAWDDA